MEIKEALGLLRSIMTQDRKKPIGFNHGHVLLTVLFLGENEVVSRNEMKSRLDLGTGSIRSLIGRLVLNHIAAASASGFRHKPLGQEIARSIADVINGPFPLNAEYLKLDRSQVLYILKGVEPDSVNPIRFRDLVVKYGGSGATTCLVQAGKVKILGLGEWLGNFSKSDEWEITKHTPEEEVTAIVVSAPSDAVAASSGAAAIFDTLELVLP